PAARHDALPISTQRRSCRPGTSVPSSPRTPSSGRWCARRSVMRRSAAVSASVTTSEMVVLRLTSSPPSRRRLASVPASTTSRAARSASETEVADRGSGAGPAVSVRPGWASVDMHYLRVCLGGPLTSGGHGSASPTLPPRDDGRTRPGPQAGDGRGNARRRGGRVDSDPVNPDVSTDIASLETTMTTVEKVLDVEELARRVDELEQMAADPELWNDQGRAQKVTS